MTIPDKKRFLAVRRAMRLNPLFKEPTFEEIIAALELPSGTENEVTARHDAFYAACRRSGMLDDAEIDWLWNYLQHYNENGFGGWGPLREAEQAEAAAQTGW